MEQLSYHNYDEKIKAIDLKSLPPLLKEGHSFFVEAKTYYQKEPTVKEAIDLYLKRLIEHLSTKHQPKPTNSLDLGFVSRFVAMHDTSQTKFKIGQYLLGLQDAISHKLITKTSPVASHIAEIQQKLIKQYNRLSEKEQITIVINDTWLKTLHSLSASPIHGLGAIADPILVDSAVPAPVLRKPSGLFESMDSISQQVNPNSFRLQDDFGEFLGDLERFELAITIEGDQGSGKTRFTYQLANAFALLGHRIAIFSLEIGRNSDLIRRMKADYLLPKNQSQVFIADTLPEGMDSIRNAAKQFDVVIIDSWNKVGVSSLDFDSLRKQFPNTIFIVIFQRTTQKTIRGGTAPLYDAGINIEVVKADESFKNNYAVTTKNRYGVTGIQFGIHSQKTLNGVSKEENIDTEFEILNS